MFRNIKCFFKKIVFPVLITLVITLGFSVLELILVYNSNVSAEVYKIFNNRTIGFFIEGIQNALIVLVIVTFGVGFVSGLNAEKEKNKKEENEKKYHQIIKEYLFNDIGIDVQLQLRI